MSRKSTVLAAALAILLLGAGEVRAGHPPSECRKYAQGAVDQYRALAAAGCQGRAGDPTWSDNYDAHYNWCLTTNADLGHQFKRRRLGLENCRAHSEANCRKYAADAVNQYSTAIQKRCLVFPLGEKDSAVWQDNFGAHFNWCRTFMGADLGKQFKWRRLFLEQCDFANSHGGPYPDPRGSYPQGPAGPDSADVSPAIWPGTQAQEQVFPAVGGQGDRPSQLRCPPGQHLSGFKGRTGLWTDQISLVCSTPTVPVARTFSESRGGAGGAPHHAWCPETAEVQVIRSIHINLIGYKYVGSISYRCKGAQSAGELKQRFGGTRTQNDNLSNVDQTCSGSQVATGLNLRYGKHVNAVGLICSMVD